MEAENNFKPRDDGSATSAISLSASENTTVTSEKHQPSELDVLCGRGKIYYDWCGNQRFRAIVEQSIEAYDQSESKLERSVIIVNIVDSVKAKGGRFLRKKAKGGQWIDIGKKAACEKVGQTIRDALIMKDPERHALKIVSRGLLEAKREVLRKAREGTTAPPSTQSVILSVPSRDSCVPASAKKANAKRFCYHAPSALVDTSSNTSKPTLPHHHHESSTAWHPIDMMDLHLYSHAHPTITSLIATFTDLKALLLKFSARTCPELPFRNNAEASDIQHEADRFHISRTKRESDEILASFPPSLSCTDSADWFENSNDFPHFDSSVSNDECIDRIFEV